MRARHVAVHERGDHEVARGDADNVGTGVLDDADELVADRPDRVVRVPPVVPEVRTAYAAEHYPHDGVGRLLDHRIGPLADSDGVGAIEVAALIPSLHHGSGPGGSPVKRSTGRDPLGRPPKGAVIPEVGPAARATTVGELPMPRLAQALGRCMIGIHCGASSP